MKSKTVCIRHVDSGKVSDIYSRNDRKGRDKEGNRLRINVFSDRVSAKNKVQGIVPRKGISLKLITDYFKEELEKAGIPTDRVSEIGVEDFLGEMFGRDTEIVRFLSPRTILSREALTVPIEVIVRRARLPSKGPKAVSKFWKLYDEDRGAKIHGHPLPSGIKDYGMLPKPIFTPSTKGKDGDEDIGFIELVALLEKWLIEKRVDFPELEKMDAETLAKKIEDLALGVSELVAKDLKSFGYILGDMKIEIGFIILNGKLTLVVIDEIGTPDSCRIWKEETYNPPEEPQGAVSKDELRKHLENNPEKPVPKELFLKMAEDYEGYAITLGLS